MTHSWETNGFDAEVRIPTTQYGYIHIHVNGSLEDIKHVHDLAVEMVKGGEGITREEMNEALDTYLEKGTGVLDVYNRMNKEQQMIFQEIKRSINRRKK